MQGFRSYPSSSLGLEPSGGFATIGVKRLATDSIGTFVLTLTGLVVGSAVQIMTQTGTAIENRTATATSEVFNIPAYSSGSAANDLRIRVRKATSAPYYQPYETLAVASVDSQSIFVNQLLD